MKAKCVVIGIGNPYLQDDRAGVVVVEQLEREGLACHTEVVYTVGFEVMDKVRGYERAIVVDACKLGNAPGSILEVSVDDIFTTHALVNSHAITLGTTLKTGYVCFPEEMPTEIRILLIEVKEIKEFTQQMSPEVERAVTEVVARIRDLVTAPAA
ncbi:MAG: hydrogenase maturation protease [Desulfobulbus sp.]|jgi:hydrogenase maturation protease|uniref:hydrogenase maturation protease n=1 Tax=Desulfobulbus sp. TaxID=895 RepID=UPI00283DC1D1|nr:hydrogenase maturation protease [Desulfobulbus sp.]MDR2551218.1 hydrogenase maturation protease [Desulfobulbus sp.]